MRKKNEHSIHLISHIIFMVLLVIVLTILALLDRRTIQHHMEEGKAEEKAVEKTLQQQDDSENVTWEDFDISEDRILLAVGEEGNLQDGGYAPIFAQPDEDGEEYTELQYHCCVEIDTSQLKKGVQYQWFPVKLPNMDQKTGYVKSDQISMQSVKVKNCTDSAQRNQIIEEAVSHIGLKFKQYGTSLETGIDCSNFIAKIYKKAGIEIANNPLEIKKGGRPIEEKDAKPGDIVYYEANKGYGHVGIYMGDGLIINSAGHAGRTYPKGGVRICRLQYFDREVYEFYTYFE